MLALDDIFADAVGDSADDVVAAEEWPAACEYGGDLSACLFVSLLTVPDVERFPVPAEFTAEKTPVDLAGSADWSLAQVREVITPTLPDGQLEQLWANEQRRPRPRAGVMKSLTAERERRGGGFPQWVADHAGSLTRSRVAAVAWALDRGQVSVNVCLTDDEELAAFEDLNSTAREDLAIWDLQRLKLAGLRQLRLDPAAGVLHEGFLRTRGVSAIESPAELAQALDLPLFDLPDACEVFAAWQAADVVSLTQWATDQLRLERFAMLASWRV
jgi:hypothetical protein